MKKSIRKCSSIGVVAILLCLTVFFCFTFESNAVSETSRKTYKIMDGVTEATVYITDSGNENLQTHILRIQNGANISFRAIQKGYYKKGSTAASRKKNAANWDESKWGFKRLSDMAADFDASKNIPGKVIAASNGDFGNGMGETIGNLVMEGNVIKRSDAEPFFAVLNDGSYVIRHAGESIDDCTEAIGGSTMLVDNGKAVVEKGGPREPRQAIGVCKDGTVVIVNIDGRETSTAGATLYDTAELLRQQGCDKAINFDGGGSATFLTKRKNDKTLVYRNIPGDGFVRNVSASLLIVKNTKSSTKTISGKAEVSMKSSKTALTKDSKGVYTYKIKGKKQAGFFRINGKTYLFGKNGKGLTKKVKVGNVTYTFKKGALVKASDKKAGTVHIGYCGAAKGGGQNLLYAYQKGNDVLNIGLNPLYTKKNSGKMNDWSPDKGNQLALPWYSQRSDVKKVYIGDGVKTVGERFLFVTPAKIFDGSWPPKGKLESVRFPNSLISIGERAFFNKPLLKNVVIPAKVSKIGSQAFAKGGKGYVKFSGSKVPTIGKSAFANTKYTRILVKNSSAWKKFIKAKKFKKFGFKRTVKTY